ncbi:MAG: hypothetical protein JWM97_1595, partial [Phycisphaerales bacterium]|nr:hypothetical protein [Phycisphaerales bacterium]
EAQPKPKVTLTLPGKSRRPARGSSGAASVNH